MNGFVNFCFISVIFWQFFQFIKINFYNIFNVFRKSLVILKLYFINSHSITLIPLFYYFVSFSLAQKNHLGKYLF